MSFFEFDKFSISLIFVFYQAVTDFIDNEDDHLIFCFLVLTVEPVI